MTSKGDSLCVTSTCLLQEEAFLMNGNISSILRAPCNWLWSRNPRKNWNLNIIWARLEAVTKLFKQSFTWYWKLFETQSSTWTLKACLMICWPVESMWSSVWDLDLNQPSLATSHSFSALTGTFPSKRPSRGSSTYHPGGIAWLGPADPTCKLTSQSTEVPENDQNLKRST